MQLIKCARCGEVFAVPDGAPLISCSNPDCSFTDSMTSFVTCEESKGNREISVVPLLLELEILSSNPDRAVDEIENFATRHSVSQSLVVSLLNSILRREVNDVTVFPALRFHAIETGNISLTEIYDEIRSHISSSKTKKNGKTGPKDEFRDKYFKLQEEVESLQKDKQRLISQCRELKKELDSYKSLYG